MLGPQGKNKICHLMMTLTYFSGCYLSYVFTTETKFPEEKKSIFGAFINILFYKLLIALFNVICDIFCVLKLGF